MNCHADQCGKDFADCNGQIDYSQKKFILTPCRGLLAIHPCARCGLFHWAVNGMPVYNQLGDYYLFWQDGQTVDENGNPVSLDFL